MGPYGPLWAHIWAHMGPYGPIYGPMWAHMGPYGPSWTGLGEGVNFPSTFRRDIWTNLVRLGSKTHFLMKFLNDSAWFCVGPGPGWGPHGPLWAHIWAHKGPYMGPCGPICAHMGPCGPIWAHVGPYGSSWTGLGRSGHVRFPTFGRISHVSGPKLGF